MTPETLSFLQVTRILHEVRVRAASQFGATDAEIIVGPNPGGFNPPWLSVSIIGVVGVGPTREVLRSTISVFARFTAPLIPNVVVSVQGAPDADWLAAATLAHESAMILRDHYIAATADVFATDTERSRKLGVTLDVLAQRDREQTDLYCSENRCASRCVRARGHRDACNRWVSW